MEEPSILVAEEVSTDYIGRWNRLISTTNWEKGRIIFEWRDALQKSDAPAASFTDEAWSQQVGGVTPQHVGRLRRVFERFGQTHDQYRGLYWSHFQAACEWPDAEMYLQGAVENGWSISQMRNQRWEALGGSPDLKPRDEDIIQNELDEDIDVRDESGSLPSTVSDSYGEVHDAGDLPSDEVEAVPFDVDDSSGSDAMDSMADAPTATPVRPFESLPPLPTDLNEGFELMKLAILSHKMCGWVEITQDGVLSVLESLRQLALAPAE